MNEKNLVICDKESRYAKKLGENVSERRDLALRIYACSSLEAVMEFQKDREIHMLLIDEAFSWEERRGVKAEQVFVMTKEKCRDLGEEEKEIFKLQSSDRICSEIFKAYLEKTHQNILKARKNAGCRLIGVYSPIHRIGKTSFATALGKELAREEKTLYLNLEHYAGMGGALRQEEGRNLGDLLYYMRQEEGNLSLRLASMVGKMEHLDYVPPILISTDLKEVRFEEWKQLLEEILEEGVYENVILDLGDTISGLFQILELCDRVCMPVLDDGISGRKMAQFEEELRCLQMQGILEKTHRFAVAEDMVGYARKIAKEEKE